PAAFHLREGPGQLEYLALQGHWLPRLERAAEAIMTMSNHTNAAAGMVHANPDSAYMKLLKPWLEKKKRLGLDRWGRDDKHVKHIYAPVIDHSRAEIDESIVKQLYPPHWGLENHVHTQLR